MRAIAPVRLCPERVPDTVEISLGVSEEIHRWRLF
jgi:hypothetical protein